MDWRKPLSSSASLFSVIAGLQKGESTLQVQRPLHVVIFDKHKTVQWATARFWLSCKWSVAA